jgi:hypothetical protein
MSPNPQFRSYKKGMPHFGNPSLPFKEGVEGLSPHSFIAISLRNGTCALY